ncbi:hypothetical protein NQ317_013463 [Molorchus minor]|uniref:Uncharacterized protein n=1 Tax=Molorchus minor TaxID=1323400 RepID=A0ABQ9J6H9_9CUCU|nr:hypothetical protein NQ317_013463 [Molorchus minor]
MLVVHLSITVNAEKEVPVRLTNINYHSVPLKKEIVLGYCSSVSSIIQRIKASEVPPKKIPSKLNCPLKTSSIGLKPAQKTKLENLLGQDTFDVGLWRKGRTMSPNIELI